VAAGSQGLRQQPAWPAVMSWQGPARHGPGVVHAGCQRLSSRAALQPVALLPVTLLPPAHFRAACRVLRPGPGCPSRCFGQCKCLAILVVMTRKPCVMKQVIKFSVLRLKVGSSGVQARYWRDILP
jgi:hypothetical protein